MTTSIYVSDKLQKALNGRTPQQALYELLNVEQPIAQNRLQHLAMSNWPTLEFEHRHVCLLHRSMVASSESELADLLADFRELSRAEQRCKDTIKATAIKLLDGKVTKRTAISFLDSICYCTFAAGDTELHKALWLLGSECIIEEASLADTPAYDVASESLRNASYTWESYLLQHLS